MVAAYVATMITQGEIMNKRGRPRKEDARTNGYRIRMTDDESKKLEELQQICCTSKAEVIRCALSDYYDKLTQK